MQETQNYINTHGIQVIGYNSEKEEVDLSTGFNFSKDFETLDKNIYISWEEI